jgi:RIO kinase 1
MSGKEASVYVVVASGEIRCVKVYKEANNRSFQQRSQYQEGRKVKNSRRARAMKKRSDYGRRELEAEWQNAEVDALYQLSGAGVRVPTPYYFSEGVLVMELIIDANGEVAPRLNDVELTPTLARQYHTLLVREVVRMLCAGLIHGDLSEYNVLVDADGPVVIDLPQVISAAGNNNARKILERDIGNLALYFSRFAPELRKTDYAKEIWKLYESGKLHPETELTGRVTESTRKASVEDVMREIDDAREDANRQFGRKIVEVDRPSESRPQRKQKPQNRNKQGDAQAPGQSSRRRRPQKNRNARTP